jgi:hypothetical protein
METLSKNTDNMFRKEEKHTSGINIYLKVKKIFHWAKEDIAVFEITNIFKSIQGTKECPIWIYLSFVSNYELSLFLYLWHRCLAFIIWKNTNPLVSQQCWTVTVNHESKRNKQWH